MSVESSLSARAVFLSYASQDAEAARRVCETLRAAGVEVWFDADGGLEHGDEWDAKIRRQIKECVLFISLISANTQARHEGYFRLEWELAAERAMSIASGVAFILPIIIDTTREPDALVPDRFRKVQWTRLPGGEVTPEVRQRFLKLWSHRTGVVVNSELEPGRPRPAQRDEGVASPTNTAVGRRVPAAVWALATLAVALAVGGYFWLRRPAEPSPLAQPVAEKPAPAPSAAPATPPPSAANEKSLVVLPLENLSPDPENAFFTDGMHTEIISTLSQIADLKVISRNSALALTGSTASLAEIAQKLGVANVMTGSVRRAGNTVRIQLELRRARDETVLWSLPKGDRDWRDVLGLQSEIADEVARVLQARAASGLDIARFMTKNPSAYDLFLKSRSAFFARFGAQPALEETIRLARKAIALDPNFMSAASMVSTCNSMLYMKETDLAKRSAYADEAKRWAETASRLVPGGAGDMALVSYLFYVENNYLRAVALGGHGVHALPNDGGMWNFYALALENLGRTAEAAEAFRRATDLDPLVPVVYGNLTRVLCDLRRPEETFSTMARRLTLTGNENRATSVLSRYQLLGEIPSDLAGLGLASRLNYLWCARKPEELLAAIDSELAKKNLGDLTSATLHLRRSGAWGLKGDQSKMKESAQTALTLVEKLKLVPSADASVLELHSAQALVRVGRAQEALALARKYVEARPEKTRPR